MIRASVLPFLLLATPAVAQEGAPDIVVTGRGLDDLPGDRAFAVVEIDRAAIDRNAADRLESVLAEVAGLQQFRRSDSRSANPTSQGISLRGIGGNASSRALLLLDGVPQADPFGGWVAFPAYAPDRLARVRVTRGGGSGFFGPGALAGTVELETAVPGRALTASVAGGSRDSLDAQATAALVRGSGTLSLSGAYARGDGFVPVVAANRGPADRPAPYEQASVAARGVIDAGGATELQVNLLAFTDTRERGTAFTGNRSEGADASVRLVGRGRWGWSALAYLQTRGFASEFASVDAARTAATRTLDQYNTPSTGVGARIELAPPLGEGVTLRLGADARGVEGRTQERFSYQAGLPTRLRVAGGENRTLGLFADGSVEAGAVTLSLGGRVDRWRIAGGFLTERLVTGGAVTDLNFEPREGWQGTGRGGVAWEVVPGATLRTAGYRGWRLPTLNELYRPFRVGADATAPDPGLKPETLTGWEVGATLAPAAGLTLAVTGFDNRLRDAIANITAARGPGTYPLVGFVSAAGVYRVRGNLDAVDSRGVELDAGWRGGAWRLAGSWSHVDPRVRATGAAAALDGLRPAQTPTDQVSASAGWESRGFAAAATLRHWSGQWEDDANERRLAPSTTVDAYLSAPLSSRLLVEARAENLADTEVQAGIAGAGIVERATPRTLWLGLKLRQER
jgi:vitamin B12 transporter